MKTALGLLLTLALAVGLHAQTSSKELIDIMREIGIHVDDYGNPITSEGHGTGGGGGGDPEPEFGKIVVTNTGTATIVVSFWWEWEGGPTSGSSIAPGGHATFTWSESSGGDNVTVSYKKAGGTTSTLVGNSYVATSTEGDADWTNGPSLSHDSGNANTVSISLDAGATKPATPDDKKTGWIVTDSGALTADVFREGIDKVVYAVGTGGTGTGGGTGLDSTTATPPSEFITNMTSALNAQKTVYQDFTAANVSAINDGFHSAMGDISTTAPTVSSSTSFTFGDIVSPIATIHMTPFEGDTGMPDLLTLAVVMREIILIIMGVFFCIFMQKKFERYYCMWWKVPQHSVQSTGPVGDTLQLVGWGKQLANAAIIIAIGIGVIAVVIASLNSQMGTIIDGMTTGNAMAKFTATWGTAMGNGPFAKMVGMLALFFPFAAAFEFLAARYLIGWTMPFLWSAAIIGAKYIRL